MRNIVFFLGVLLSSFIVVYSNVGRNHKSDTYDEELVIKRLNSEQILSKFRFIITTETKLGPDYVLFPRIIAEVSKKYGIDEFHFSLAQGFWHNVEWGIPPQPAAPSGAELFALFSGNESSVDDKWNHFVNSLNGIFCTSLLEVVPALTASPQFSAYSRGYSKGPFVRYGALAGETICTENLTPWRKLLPCKETGISVLLNPEKLYSSYYHSMSVHLTKKCQETSASCDNRARLVLSLDMVTDLDLRSRSLDWSIYSIFGRKIEDKCKVARSTRVIFQKDRPSLSIESPSEEKNYQRKIYYVYDINKLPSISFPLNLHCRYRNKLELSERKPGSLLRHLFAFTLLPQVFANVINVHTFLGGTDQQAGKITTTIENLQLISQKAIYSHVIPWFIQIYFHTIKFTCNPSSRNLKESKNNASAKLLNFVAAKSRKRPFLLEYELILPEDSICDFSFDFDKAFLRVTDFAPDANHGMYVPAATISFVAEEELWVGNRTLPGDTWVAVYEELDGAIRPHLILIYGEVLLVSLPVPDFSMPFNVICFVSTAIAMLFGPVHSLTTKILIPVSEKDKDLVPKPLLTAFIIKLLDFLKRLLGKVMGLKKEEKLASNRDVSDSEENSDEQRCCGILDKKQKNE